MLVTRRASAIFARAQRFLDRISVVVRENITGARVIRAFNKATGRRGGCAAPSPTTPRRPSRPTPCFRAGEPGHLF
ncbi:MAG: hypothetical protein ACLR53_08800 [Evtepia gabavorous]